MDVWSQTESCLALFRFHKLLELLLAHLAVPIVVELGENRLNLLLCHLLGNLQFNLQPPRKTSCSFFFTVKGLECVYNYVFIIHNMFVLNVDISHNLGKFCPRDEAVLVFVEQLERRVRRTHHLHLKVISNCKHVNITSIEPYIS